MKRYFMLVMMLLFAAVRLTAEYVTLELYAQKDQPNPEERIIDRSALQGTGFDKSASPIRIDLYSRDDLLKHRTILDSDIIPYLEGKIPQLNINKPGVGAWVAYFSINPNQPRTLQHQGQPQQGSSQLAQKLEDLRDALENLRQALSGQGGSAQEYTIEVLDENYKPKFSRKFKGPYGLTLSDTLKNYTDTSIAVQVNTSVTEKYLTEHLWDDVIAPALKDKNFDIPPAYKTEENLNAIIDVTGMRGLDMTDLNNKATLLRYPSIMLKDGKKIAVYDQYNRSPLFKDKKADFTFNSKSIDEKMWNIIKPVFTDATPRNIIQYSDIKDDEAAIERAREGLRELKINDQEKWIPAPKLFVESASIAVDVSSEAKQLGYTAYYPSIIRTIALDPSGKKMGVFFNGGVVKIWDISTNSPTVISTITYTKNNLNDNNTVLCAAFSADFTRLALGTTYRTIQLYDISDAKNPTLLRTIGTSTKDDIVKPSTSCLAFSPDGKYLAAGGFGSGWLDIYDMNNLTKGAVSSHIVNGSDGNEQNTGITGLAFNAASNGIYVGAKAGESVFGGVKYYISKNSFAQAFDISWDKNNIHDEGTRIAIGKDNIAVYKGYVAGRDPYKVALYNGNEEILEYDDSTQMIKSIAFSPDGVLFAGGTNKGHIMLWDISSGKKDQVKKLTALEKDHKPIYDFTAVAFNNDGSKLVSGADGVIVIWNKVKK